MNNAMQHPAQCITVEPNSRSAVLGIYTIPPSPTLFTFTHHLWLQTLFPSLCRHRLLIHLHLLINRLRPRPHNRILSLHPSPQRPIQLSTQRQFTQIIRLLLVWDVSLLPKFLVLQLLEVGADGGELGVGAVAGEGLLEGCVDGLARETRDSAVALGGAGGW